MAEAQREINHTSEKIRGYTSESGGGRVTMFGKQVPRLLEVIRKNAHRFARPVLGPIGVCVSLREGCGNKWDLALEKWATPTFMRSFIVASQSDRNILFQLMRECSCESYHPIIVQPPSDKYRAESPRLPCDALTILDALIIPDDTVFNCVIDQKAADRIALLGEEELVARHFQEVHNGDDVLKFGLTAVITRNAITISFKQGSRSSEGNSGRNHVQGFFAPDTASLVARLREELEVQQQELNEMRPHGAELNRANTELTAQLKRLDQTRDNNTQSMRQASSDKRRAEQALVQLQDASRVDTSSFENEIADLQRALEASDGQMEEKSGKVAALDKEVKAKQAEKRTADRRRTELGVRLDELAAQITEVANSQCDKDRRIEDLQRQLERRKADLEKEERKLQDQVRERDEKVRVAREQSQALVVEWDGEPLPLGNKDTKATLDRRIKKLQAELEQGKKEAELEGFTADLLLQSNNLAKATYEAARQEFKELNSRHERLGNVNLNIQRKWGESFQYCIEQSRRKFDDYARAQGANGSLLFDADKEEMVLVVKMDSNDPKTQASDVKNLSGGERSFITLCLLHVVSDAVSVLIVYIYLTVCAWFL